MGAGDVAFTLAVNGAASTLACTVISRSSSEGIINLDLFSHPAILLLLELTTGKSTVPKAHLT